MTACMSFRWGLYNPTPTQCWITEYPRGCMGEECIRGANYRKIRVYFLMIPIFLCILVIVVSMCMLYNSVKSTERRSEEYTFSRWPSTRTTVRSNSNVNDNYRKVKRPRNPGQNHKMVYRRAMLYIVSFSIVWTPLIFQVIIGKVILDNSLGSFISILLVQIFGPLQGIINFLIYRKINPISIAMDFLATYLQRLSSHTILLTNRSNNNRSL